MSLNRDIRNNQAATASLINLFSTPQERERRLRESYRRWQQPQTLRDGTTGWPTRYPRRDDCLAACVSTCLQVPIADVFDPCIDARLEAGETVEEVNRSLWAGLAAWLEARGLRLVVHETVPVPVERWIGIVPRLGPFQDHCVVMTQNEVLFDPVNDTWVPKWHPNDISWGLSFPPANQESDEE